MCVVLDVESFRYAHLEKVGEQNECEAAEDDSGDVGELLKDRVERQGDEEQSDQGGKEPGSEKHLIPKH